MAKDVERKKYLENFEKIYRNLNPSQRLAVDTIEGPVLVIAGPGTGKTQVLTARIANILLKTDVPSTAVLALTFTDSGVKAMRERLISLIGPEAYYVNIYTFHAFCSDVIKDNPDKFVTREELEPLTQLERIQIFREILDEADFEIIKPYGSRYFYIRSLIKNIQDLKREGVGPDELENALEKIKNLETDTKSEEFDERDIKKNEELIKVYKVYQEKIAKKSRYDFEDMINLVVKAFSDDETILRRYQERFQYILLDEFQDTNTPQNKVVALLSSFWGQAANVFAVGDDEQSIYRFQGASLENILYFKKLYPQTEVITLKDNYRSSQSILNTAYNLIGHNEVRLSNYIKGVERQLVSVSDSKGENVKVGHFSSGVTESFFVASKIKELVEKGVPPSAIAVIYRNNSDAAAFSDMISRLGVPYELTGGEDILKDYDLGKLLKIFGVILKIRKKEEDLDLFTLFNFDFLAKKFGLDYLDTLKLSRFASDLKINFWESLNHPDILKKSTVKNANAFKILLESLNRWSGYSFNYSFTEFFEKVTQESGYLDWVLSLPDSVEKLNRLNSLFAQVKRLSLTDHSLSLEKFFEDLSILIESNIALIEEDLDIKTEAVSLTTAHGAKGLEFDYVFIVMCLDGKFGNNKVRELIKLPPNILDVLESAETSQLRENKERNEDERRLFYVALTRAKKEVFISYADSYLTENSKKEAVPSMFISEIDESLKDSINVRDCEMKVKEILYDILKPAKDTRVSLEEKEFLKTVFADFRLSATALNTYLECPYKFKLNNLLRTPRAKNPSLCLGSAVHKALEIFMRNFLLSGVLPASQYLIDHFESALNGEILTEKDRRELLKKGKKILKAYLDYYKDTIIKPLAVEKFFGYGFSKVYLDDIPLTGKIDKIERLEGYPEKGRLAVKVIDYKTDSKPKSRNYIEGKTEEGDLNYKRQLIFYKMLADLDRSFNYEVVESELDFIVADNGKFSKASFTITPEEVGQLKETIRMVMGKLHHFEFPRTSEYRFCSRCDFKSHCWPDGVPSKKGQLELFSGGKI